MLLRRWMALLLVVLGLAGLIVMCGPTRTSDLAYWLAFLALISLPPILIFALRGRPFQAIQAGEIGVVERFHQLYDVAPPGLLPLLPFVEVARIIPTSEQIKEYHIPAVLTNDGVSIAFDLLVCYRVKRPTDRLALRQIAEKVLYDVSDWHEAIKAMSIGALHQTVGGMSMKKVLGEWTTIGDGIKAGLQPTAGDWGVDIRRVALMNPKISATLEAALEDPHKAAAEAIATEYRAGGEAQRIRMLSNGLQESRLPNEVLIERYIQALERISDSPSTHIVLPIELVRGLRDLIMHNLPAAGAPAPAPGKPAQPRPAAAPQAPAQPQPAGQPKPPAQAQAQPAGQAKPAAGPQPTAQPTPAAPPQAQPAVQAKPAAGPQPTAQPRPAAPPQAQPAVQAKPAADPQPAPQPRPTAAPQPKPRPQPAGQAKPDVAPQPTAPPKPTVQPKPAPEPPAAATPKPEAPDQGNPLPGPASAK